MNFLKYYVVSSILLVTMNGYSKESARSIAQSTATDITFQVESVGFRLIGNHEQAYEIFGRNKGEEFRVQFEAKGYSEKIFLACWSLISSSHGKHIRIERSGNANTPFVRGCEKF